MIFSPCKDCSKRKIGCHSFCDLYKKYKLELNIFQKNFVEYSDYEMYKNEKIAKMEKEKLRNIKRGRKFW